MSWFLTAIATGTAAFVATNLDDLLIVTLFFAQVSATFHRRHVVTGQYLGFTALIVSSLPGFFGGLIAPREWIGLLGLLPIVIGIKHLMNRGKTVSEVQTVTGLSQPCSSNTPARKGFAHAVQMGVESLLNPHTCQVAVVTFANGGDNIGIYVPLFASSNLARLGVILSVFFLLMGVWCYLGYRLTRHRAIAQVLTRYSNSLVPLVLISLGIFILLESGTLTLLP